MSALTTPAPLPTHPVTFADWVVSIGIDRSAISCGEMRLIGSLIHRMATSVVRHARVRGINDADDADTHEAALNAAEFLLGMARAFGDEAEAMDQGDPEPHGRQLAGTF